MRKRLSSAFTLIEIVTTMAIIVILTSIVVGIAGYVQNKGARSRAQSEIAMLSSALENYKGDTGGYPQDTDKLTTDTLSPKKHFTPTDTVYSDSSLFLYKELTGDKSKINGTGDPDGVPDTDAAGNPTPIYLKQYDPRIILADRDANTKKITKVKGFQDPWGYMYGYSTAAMAEEQKFQLKLKQGQANPTRSTGATNPGYNMSSPDMWSTAGNKPSPAPASDKLKDQETAKWVKNW